MTRGDGRDVRPGFQACHADRGEANRTDAAAGEAAVPHARGAKWCDGREEYIEILRRHALPEGVIEHSIKVAEVARLIASRLAERGEAVDVERVVGGALLHDVGKSHLHVRRGARNHAEASAEIVRDEGRAELAEIVARHILDSIISAEEYPRNWEEKVVFYADKIVTRRLVTVDERFADLRGRRADIADLLKASFIPTKALEAEILTAAGLTWSDLVSHFGGEWAIVRRP
ncbi:MAG: HD domain-containing protein [Firmicutes bacterium]|jgi:putative nucleotidyltransferase with HDIG domain|nr:HD domain-containing protein [Bacillota bacterium]MDH7495791.1 HD domain-containing protein [Bacillota bacterium]